MVDCGIMLMVGIRYARKTGFISRSPPNAVYSDDFYFRWARDVK
jgi:hypothetical protein